MEGYPQQANFSAGEVSPLLLGRNDISKYANGLQVCENFVVKPQGAARRRSGSRYVNAAKTGANTCRLKKFQFSTTVYYMLEFGNLYVRIYQVSGNAWTLVTVSSNPLELATPYLYTDLQYLKFSQSGDQMFITHPNYPPQVISFSGGTNWTFLPITFLDGLEQLVQDGPYLDTDKRYYTMTVQGVQGAGLTSTNADFSNSSVGKYVIINTKVYLITSFITTTSVNVQFIGFVNSTTFTNGGGNTYVYTAGSVTYNNVTYIGAVQHLFLGLPSAHNSTVTNSIVNFNGTYYKTGYLDSGKSNVGVSYILTIQNTVGVLTLGGVNVGISNTMTITDTQADFTTSSVGKYIEYNFRGSRTIGLIIQYISTTQVLIQPFDNVIDYTDLNPNTTFLYISSSITVNGVTFIGKLDASLAVWTTQAQYAYIKINGVWYLTGYHADFVETQNGVSQDVLAVQQVCPMQSVTGVISYSNHLITGTIQCSNPLFNSSTDVGRCLRLNFNSLIVWCTISTVTSSTIVQVNFGRTLPNDPQIPSQVVGNGQTNLWQLGAWYTGNYPSISTFHEGRMVFGSTTLQPQTFWMSNSEDYFNYQPTLPDSTVTEANAITVTVDSGKVNNILWFQSTIGVLLMGTIGAEWEVTSSNYGTPLSPTNIVVNEQTNHGSYPISDPQKIGSRILFVQKSGNKVKELSYFFQTNSYIANDMTILSEHILRSHGGASFTAWSQEPNNTMWVLCNDGTIAGFTYDYEQQISAWHHHTVAGGTVESIEVIPSIDGSEDQLWMVVNRTINGSTVRYLEYLEQEFWPTSPTDKNNMFFLDCMTTVTGSNLSTLSGAGSYLVGQTVQVVADGTLRNPVVVPSNGNIVISGLPASVVTFGINYTSKLLSLPIEAGSVSGTSQGKEKRINKITFRIYNSIGMKYGVNFQNLTLVSFRQQSDNLGQSPALFTGDKKLEVPSDYALQGTFAIQQDQPYPLTIIAVMPQLQTFV